MSVTGQYYGTTFSNSETDFARKSAFLSNHAGTPVQQLLKMGQGDKGALERYVSPQAELDEESLEHARELFSPQRDPIRVLARADAPRFRAQRGRRLRYSIVRATLVENDPNGLKPNDQIFVVAEGIRSDGNMTSLTLRLPETIKGVGADLAGGITVHRRDFSARENQLRKILERSGPDSLRGITYLARLLPRRGTWTLWRGVARRSRELIRNLLRGRKEPLYAIIAERDENHDEVVLELQVGVLLDLPVRSLVGQSKRFAPGSVVRLDFDGDNFIRVHLAVRGDIDYVPESGRQVVLLPKESLLRSALASEDRSSEQFWSNVGQFTVAGLPNLSAALDLGDEGVARARRLMETSHPKIAHIRSASHMNKVIASPPDEICAASLRVHRDSLTPQFRVTGTNSWRRIAWSQLSFADENAEDLLRRMSHTTWQYHDQSTGHWKPGGGQRVVRTDLPVQADCFKEPVFFSHRADSWTLRYPREEVQRFGLPTGELINYLERIGSDAPTRFTVVGNLANRSDNAAGLWIELGPGRITELLGDVLSVRYGERSFSMEDFCWEAFSTGDEIEIAIEGAGSTLVPRLLFCDSGYTPGPRGAFGRGRVLLILISFQVETNNPRPRRETCESLLVTGQPW